MTDKYQIQQLSFLPGQKILCSTGEHSSYTVHGCYEVLQPFDTKTFREFLTALLSQQLRAYDNRAFLTFLLAQGYLKVVPMAELYLGDYGQTVFMLNPSE
jgi:hypothetical protein